MLLLTVYKEHNPCTYLSLQAGWVLKHVEQLRVVNLKQHPSNLASKVGMLALKEGKSENLF